MAEPEVAEKLRSLFAGGDREAESHTQHVLAMQQAGQWGTEQEIAAAAHLLDSLLRNILQQTVLSPALCSTLH